MKLPKIPEGLKKFGFWIAGLFVILLGTAAVARAKAAKKASAKARNNGNFLKANRDNIAQGVEKAEAAHAVADAHAAKAKAIKAKAILAIEKQREKRDTNTTRSLADQLNSL